MPDSSSSLRSHLLIAMPSLHDTHFSRSVTLICEHSLQEGAMGIILNQPSSIDISDLLSEMDVYIEEDLTKHHLSTPIFSGGPVEKDRGFILYNSEIEHESDLEILPELFLTSSKDMLTKIASGQAPDNTLVMLGYAGWSPGQLEEEIAANAWLTSPYHHHLVFNTPSDQQWLAAGTILGVDLNLLSSQTGHA